MPVITAMKRRKQQEEEAWERDPRWNGDKFRYMPKLPEELLTDKKYSRLAACSRSSRYAMHYSTWNPASRQRTLSTLKQNCKIMK